MGREKAHSTNTVPCLPRSASEDCGHEARAAASVHHGDNPERLFIRRVGNEVVADDREPQGARGKVRPFVALVRKGHKAANAAQYVLAHATGRERVTFRDKFPNFGDVQCGEGMKVKSEFGG